MTNFVLVRPLRSTATYDILAVMHFISHKESTWKNARECKLFLPVAGSKRARNVAGIFRRWRIETGVRKSDISFE